jgi:hypothetical protein
MDEVVNRRGGTPDEPEVLDETAQQKIIDDIESDYQKMQRTQIVLTSLVSTLSATGCTVFGFATGSHWYLLPSIAAFVWMALSVRHKNKLWQLSPGLEIVSIVVTFVPNSPLSMMAKVVVHLLYLLVALFWWSSNSFLQSLPGQIQNLSNLKYGVKLA